MPAKLFLQLRLLNPSLPVNCLPPAMKLGLRLPLSSSSSAATFSRLFPFRLKHQCLGIQRRRLSTRSDRSRDDISPARAAKSLVDDEAELSAWVSDLSRGTSRGRGDDSDGDFSGRNVRARVKDNRGSRDSFSGKRMINSGSDSEDFDNSSRPRMERGSSTGPFRRNLPTSRQQFDSRRDDGDNGFRKKSPRFQEEGNSSRTVRPDSRSRNENSNSFSRNSQRFDTKKGGGNGEFSTRKSSPRFQDGRLGSSSSVAKRGSGGGRDMESGFRKGGMDSRKQAPLLSEDDEEDEDEDEDDDDDDDEVEIGEVNKLSIGDMLSDDECDSDEEDEVGDVGNALVKESAKGSARASTGDSESYLSNTRFDECSISPLSLKGIKDAGYERLTVVQEATLPLILKGKDVLARAKTGTGKTVAFLLPAIEVVVNSPAIGRDQKRPPIHVLVVCPTRELACQAAAEADTLLKYHPSIGVQVVIGGTRLALEQKRMQANPCQILVATPGRLRDHMENTAGFATRLTGVKVLVLDEADHLLDMGFRRDIETIIAAVPKQRQTLLFSATVPQEVRQVCHIALKRDHEFINTVQSGSEDTHSQVKQSYLVAPLDKQFSLLYALLKEHIADDVEYKVIVFCTTAMLTKLVAELLSELKMNVREIHSRKSQSYRTKVSDEFRKSKGLILATSDVSARGVDYPDVTLVIQIGLPADKQQYIHRLGRTGRKGKEGEGVLLLSPWEEFFLSYVKDLPITKATEPSIDPDTKRKVERGLSNVEMKSKESAYQAWLGYYNSNKTVGRDKIKLVELANEFSRSMCLDNPPAIAKIVLGKMGLKNVPGLRMK